MVVTALVMEYLVFIAFGLFFVSCGSENRNIYGPKCLSCTGARDPTECTSATTCWASQKCYSERYTHADGHILYDFGCKIKEECELLSGSRDRRLDITIDLCEECCEGEFCNVNTCVNRTESSETACYACAHQENPNDCHKLERCGPTEICYAEKVITDSPNPRYTMGCLSQQVCSYLNKGPQLIGKRSTHLCQKCCSTSGCNMDVCGDNQPQQTAHMVTNDQTTTTYSHVTTDRFHSMHSAQTTISQSMHSPTPSTGGVRLVDGESSNKGRVEIFHDGQWGTICDDLFNSRAAGVVCHMLGYPRTAAVARKFGRGTGPIWLDDVTCLGDETSILDCNHRSIGTTNCGHEEDIGVECYVPGCPADFLGHNGFCYPFDNNTSVRSYDEAERECSKLGARLLSVDTLEENNFVLGVLSNVTGSTHEWLTGGKYLNSRWVWQSVNKPFTAAFLHGPAKHLGVGPCLSYFRTRTVRFTAVTCNGSPRNYICKRQMV